jgi:hypothetical protein
MAVPSNCSLWLKVVCGRIAQYSKLADYVETIRRFEIEELYLAL